MFLVYRAPALQEGEPLGGHERQSMRFLAFVLAAGLFLSGCSTDTSTPNAFLHVDQGATDWVPVGPNPLLDAVGQRVNVSGRVASLLPDPSNPQRLVVGSASGGVWTSRDDGATWSTTTDRAVNLAIGALVLDPNHPGRVYAGTGEGTGSGSPRYGNGLLVSNDSGTTYQLVSGSDTFLAGVAVSRLAVSADDQSLLVATFRVLRNPSTAFAYGLYRYDGQAFSRLKLTADPQESLSLSDLVQSSTLNAQGHHDLFVAAAVDENATATNGTAVNGIYRSQDGGATWQRLSNGLPPAAETTRIELALAQGSSPSLVYALMGRPLGQGGEEGDNTFQGVWRTVDGGDSWQQLQGKDAAGRTIDQALVSQAYYNMAIAVHPSQPNLVYAGGSLGIVKLVTAADPLATQVTTLPTATSTSPHVDIQCMAYDGLGRLLVGTDGGVWRLPTPQTADAATPWENLNGRAGQALETLQLNGIAVNPANPRVLVAGTQDNGTALSRNNRVWTEVAGGDGGFAWWSPVDAQTLVHTYQRPGNEKIWVQVSRDGGATFTNYTEGISAQDKGEFYPPLSGHPVDGRLATATDTVYERLAGDTAWVPQAPGTLGNSTVVSLAYAPSDAGSLYAGLRNGQVWRRSQAGQPMALQGTPSPGNLVNWLAVDPVNPLEVFAAQRIYGPTRLMRSRDGGQTWSSVVGDLDLIDNSPIYTVMALRVGSTQEILAGTNLGVVRSEDGGNHWEPVGSSLPHVRVTQLAWSSGVLFAGTYGRGAWMYPSVPLAPPPATQPVLSRLAEPFRFIGEQVTPGRPRSWQPAL